MADPGGSIRPGIKKGAASKKPPLFKGSGRCRPDDLAIVLIHSPEGLNVQKERLLLSFFAGCYNDAEDGDEYTEEYSAPGYDENGNPVEIFMTFTQVKGEEIDPENLNWFQDSDRVEAL